MQNNTAANLETQNRPRALEVRSGGKKKASPMESLLGRFLPILAGSLVLGLAICLLQSFVTITELTNEIQKANVDLVNVQSEHNYYTTRMNANASLSNVEEAAARLGLIKMDESQITYIRLDSTDTMERKESAVQKWTDMLHIGVMALMGVD